MTTIHRTIRIAAAGLTVTAFMAAATRSLDPEVPADMGPGMMMGPGVGGRGMFGRMCGPGAGGFMEWRIDRLEQALKLTDAQRPKFDEFKAASAKAAETIRGACPTELPNTMPARMEVMEKRTEAMLQAIKTVRPALDAFYATLTEDQKQRIESRRGERHYWRWRDRW